MCMCPLGVLDMPEGSGRDILKARTEKRLAETVCEFVTHAYRQHNYKNQNL